MDNDRVSKTSTDIERAFKRWMRNDRVSDDDGRDNERASNPSDGRMMEEIPIELMGIMEELRFD